MSKVYVLYAYDDEDAPVLESFDKMPTDFELVEHPNGSALYSYDLLDNPRMAVNGVLIQLLGAVGVQCQK